MMGNIDAKLEVSVVESVASAQVDNPVSSSVSVIVPAYCEAENLQLLIPRIVESFKRTGNLLEIIVVDDNSPDETVAVCGDLSETFPLRLHVRKCEKGLSSAVIAGMRLARGSVFVVMDANLSHPAEKAPELVAQLSDDQVDFVIGSRYVMVRATDSDGGWLRYLSSRAATLLAWPLTSASDPMAGFFAMRHSLFSRTVGVLNPVGYKIGLEFIVKGECESVVEVPIHFSDCVHGESKLSLYEQVNYLRHLKRLYEYRYQNMMSLLLFLCVGATGMVLDLLVYGVLLTVLDVQLARGVAIFIAMTWNYLLNRQFTFSEVDKNAIVKRYIMYCLGCSCGAVVNWGVSIFLASALPPTAGFKLVAAIVGIVSGTGLNYIFARFVVFRGKASGSPNLIVRCVTQLWARS